MSDRVFFSLALLIAAGLIALAAVYPQGTGARSPAPFGHETTAETALRQKAAAPKPRAPDPAMRGPL